MKNHFLIACAAALISSVCNASARDLTIATWNLGWHISQAEAKDWIKACGQPFAMNTASGLWEPSTTGATKRGWELK